jgi:translation initiation factor IF-1
MAAEGTELEGIVTSLNRDVFMVELDYNGRKFTARCSIAGKLRKNQIKIVEGDRVRVEVQHFDLQNTSQGRINRRL